MPTQSSSLTFPERNSDPEAPALSCLCQVWGVCEGDVYRLYTLTCVCFPTARAKKSADEVETLVASMPKSEFDSPLAQRLEHRFKFYVATSAAHGTLASNNRRLQQFLQFGHSLFCLQGRSATDEQVLASDNAARLFLISLADSNPGKTVVEATAKMINTHRSLAHPGICSLHRLKAIKYVLDSVQKNVLDVAKQSPGLTAMHVSLTLDNWTDSPRWDETMFAAVIGIGFQATLRPIEISSLGSQAVWWVLKSGEEIRSNFSAGPPPPLRRILGVIMALLPRKNRQGKMSYIPSPAGKVVRALHKHATNMSRLCPDSLFFFPARRHPPHARKRYTWHEKATWIPNPTNPFSQRSISDVAIPTALYYCCGIKRKHSAIYTGYALRVGGTTHHEESGTAESVRKNLAEWMSLSTARHYLQHSPTTQFGYLRKAAI